MENKDNTIMCHTDQINVSFCYSVIQYYHHDSSEMGVYNHTSMLPELSQVMYLFGNQP